MSTQNLFSIKMCENYVLTICFYGVIYEQSESVQDQIGTKPLLEAMMAKTYTV